LATLPPQTRARAPEPVIPLLTDRAYERIKHDVITCVLAPGTEVSEPQLCLQYHLGKAPVRMALIRLAHDGLVRAIPRRGYLIAPVTLKDIQDIFELRLMLEPMAARMAAGNIDAQRARALEEASGNGYQMHDARSISRFLDANKAFHVAIAGTTGNIRLSAMIAQLHDQMTRLLHLGLGLRNRSHEMQNEQRALLKALVRGNGDMAERLAREQIEAARSMVLSAVMSSRSVMNLALEGN
jgi:DNA-binding GntR family transcriptional regulator